MRWPLALSATFRLQLSRLALDPADVIQLANDSREIELWLVSIANSDGRGIDAVGHNPRLPMTCRPEIHDRLR